MELLQRLYMVHSPSGDEKKLKRVIRRWVLDEKKIDARVTYDNKGNMYIVKGECGDGEYYPCVVAHLDQVQKTHSKDFVVSYDEKSGIIYGFSKSKREFQGLGADDKNGVWIALRCLLEFDVIKVAFFVGEEIGCVGSSEANLEFFKDVRYILECDRRGSSDLITSIAGLKIASRSFVTDLLPIAEMYGYKEESGMMTDVLELSERSVGVSCVNMSCGYYEPHTNGEFTIFSDLVNTLNFVKDIITSLVDRYDNENPEYVSRYYNGYGGYYNSSYGSYYDFDDKYDTYQEEYAFNETTGTWEWRDKKREVEIIKASDFADAYSFIDQFIYMNIDTNLTIDELYSYISSDLETFNFTYEDYLNYIEENWGITD